MRFEVHIATDNAAFDDGRGGDYELARILRDLADRLDEGDVRAETPHRLRDTNGNRVGYALWTGQPLPEPLDPGKADRARDTLRQYRDCEEGWAQLVESADADGEEPSDKDHNGHDDRVAELAAELADRLGALVD